MEVGQRWTSNAELMNLDTAITAMSALMIVMLVPSGRYLGLISYLLDLTSSQAVVMGWAPLVSASFLFIWACNWVGAIILPSWLSVSGFVEYKYLKPVAFQHPGRVLETVVVILPTVREYTRRRTDSEQCGSCRLVHE